MGSRGECEPLIRAPLRVVARDKKIIIGPYRRIRGSYHLALGLEMPVPYRPRWVLHVLADPKGLLRDEGVAEVLGYRAMIKHECLHKTAKRLAPAPLRGFLWVPGWGVPLVVVEQVGGLTREEKDVLAQSLLDQAVELLRDLAEAIRLVEV